MSARLQPCVEAGEGAMVVEVEEGEGGRGGGVGAARSCCQAVLEGVAGASSQAEAGRGPVGEDV